jgi:methylenetetrahydrofolate--tRNA-(uracil-5-)-methyltransferase
VGFQTRLKWADQRAVFSTIPGLADAEFVRFGVIHRNTYLNAPRVLLPTYQSQTNPRLLFAGQLTGVEGYLESAASGLVAGTNAARLATGLEPMCFPEETVVGALAHYITSADPRRFQPMNANIGILPALASRVRDKRKRHEMLGVRALDAVSRISRA